MRREHKLFGVLVCGHFGLWPFRLEILTSRISPLQSLSIRVL